MNSVVGNIRRSVESIKEKILKNLIKQQKKELDKKIDSMLKPLKMNQIRELGLGKRIGKPLRHLGKGLSLLKKRLLG